METANKTKQQTKTHPYVFQICLLKGFEDDPIKTARKINTCVYNKVKASGKDVTPYIGVDFEKYEIDDGSVYTWCNYEFLNGVAKGRQPSKKEIELFLFLCAVRSIVFRRNIAASNWLGVAYRAAGYNSPDKNIELTGICKRFTYQSKAFRKRLITEMSKYKIDLYSAIGVRGFYVYQNIELIEVIQYDTEKRKKNKEENERIRKIRESYHRLYHSGELKNIINEAFKKNIYSNELGLYLCENAITGTQEEYTKLTSEFFSQPRKNTFRSSYKSDKAKATLNPELVSFMTNA